MNSNSNYTRLANRTKYTDKVSLQKMPDISTKTTKTKTELDNEIAAREFLEAFTLRFQGKSWADIHWELQDEEDEKIRKNNRIQDETRKGLWEKKEYDLEDGEVFE